MPEAWALATAAVAGARLTVVLGPPDAGKTTLTGHVASALALSGAPVGVVDADLGQSEIGPPTTVGLGRVRGALGRLRDAEPVGLAFVGATSPAGSLLGTLTGVARMVARGRTLGLERLVVDTSGLVAGDLGRALKQAKIDLLEPDLLLCLQRDRECEHILRPYDAGRSPRVLRLPALAGVPRRSTEARRQYRRERLLACLAGARPVTLDLRRVALRSPALFTGEPLPAALCDAATEAVGRTVLWAERRGPEVVVVTDAPLGEDEATVAARLLGPGPLVACSLADLVGLLAGLESAGRDTLGLGVVQAVDFGARTLTVATTVATEAVACVTVGRTSPEG